MGNVVEFSQENRINTHESTQTGSTSSRALPCSPPRRRADVTRCAAAPADVLTSHWRHTVHSCACRRANVTLTSHGAQLRLQTSPLPETRLRVKMPPQDSACSSPPQCFLSLNTSYNAFPNFSHPFTSELIQKQYSKSRGDHKLKSMSLPFYFRFYQRHRLPGSNDRDPLSKQRVQNVKEELPIKVLWSPWRLSRTGLRVQLLTLTPPTQPTTAQPGRQAASEADKRSALPTSHSKLR